ncbi:hypothetical protein QJQ45_015124 [Haematococcus lacustris]|nr:hypothetical protein QJQ45_015124 [Haematococcus lacustris]
MMPWGIKPHLRHLAAASSAGTSLVANLKHITVTLATWDAVWEVYLDLKWARQRLRLYGAQDRALEQFFNKLEREMAQLSMNRHGRAKQLVVFFGAATIGTAGGWGADAVLRACRKVVCRPRGTDQLRGRVVLVDEHRTSRVSSAVNGQQPCEVELDKLSATRPAGWKPPTGQVEPRLVRPAWSQQRGQPVRGMMWCPVVAPRKPPQAPRSSQAATQPAASEPGPSTPPPAKRSKPAAEPTKGKGKAKGKAAKAKPAPQPGRWLDRDCNAALNMQRIGESRWRPLELCFWPDQGALPAKGKEYPGLGYKRVRDKPPKAQEQQQQQPAGAHLRGVIVLNHHPLRRVLSPVPLHRGPNVPMSAKSMENDSVPAGELFPDYRRSVALKYVKRGFHILTSHSLTILCVPLAAFGVLELMSMYHQGELQKLWLVGRQTELTFDLVRTARRITVVLSLTAMLVALVSYAVLKQKPVYMLDFAVCKPPDSWMVSYDQFMSGSVKSKVDEAKACFIRTTLHRLPTHPTMAAAREEFEDVMFTTIHDLLQKTGVKPKEIAILVINCSLFNPTPSLSAMVINHFKMRSNIISYNLSGMGCGSSPISIDLARQMLQLYPHSYALVLSTENITQNWYPGNDRSMLMPNCLFRVGGAAMLLSNRRRDAWRAKYELLHTVRTHLGGNDLAYKCIFQMEDDDGIMGVRLSKELMAVAGEALKVNVTTLGPLVLPISEQLVFMVNLVLRKVLHRKIKPYIPDFKLAFDKVLQRPCIAAVLTLGVHPAPYLHCKLHTFTAAESKAYVARFSRVFFFATLPGVQVCIHTGGRAVVDEIEKQLHLTPSMVEPSRATLYRYGNTSSSSVWYVLAYIETHMGLQRGERVWQMGFGSGFKCNSAVWRARRRIKVIHQAWSDFDVDEMRAHLASLPNHHTKPVPKAA